MWKYALLSIVALTGLLTVLIRPKASSAHTEPLPVTTDLSPAWDLRDVDGQPVSSAQFLGKVVVLDFWATWCPPCQAEIPGFVELQKTYGDQGLVVIGVSMDQAGPSVVKDFMKQHGMNYPVVMGDDAINQAFGGIEGLPTTFIINRAGTLIDRHVGYTDKADFERAIKPLL
jgi:thiol-disulfide isomerase/thioredoxin